MSYKPQLKGVIGQPAFVRVKRKRRKMTGKEMKMDDSNASRFEFVAEKNGVRITRFEDDSGNPMFRLEEMRPPHRWYSESGGDVELTPEEIETYTRNFDANWRAIME